MQAGRRNRSSIWPVDDYLMTIRCYLLKDVSTVHDSITQMLVVAKTIS